MALTLKFFVELPGKEPTKGLSRTEAVSRIVLLPQPLLPKRIVIFFELSKLIICCSLPNKRTFF